MVGAMTPDELRAEFPVTEQIAFLNAGSCGPLPRAALESAAAMLGEAVRDGRAQDHFERLVAAAGELRAAYASVLSAAPEDVALTTATSEGLVRVVLGLDLAGGDEVLIADDEHPGLLGPLGALRSHTGVAVRAVPADRLAESISPSTRLIACSHVAWMSGRLAPDLSGADVPVLLDGAQAAGAIPVDVSALGCAFYAAPGQKWLCGPIGTGLLYISPAWRGRLRAVAPTYVDLAEPAAGLDAQPWPDARAHDAVALSLETLAVAQAGHDTLAAFGWSKVFDRGPRLAAELAERLAAAGRDLAPRGPSTLVSWRSGDPAAEVERHRQAGIVTRYFPDMPWVRASVGAWNNDDDLDRLLAVSGS